MLYGCLAEIRRQFSGNAVLVRTSAELSVLPGVERVELLNGTVKLHLSQCTDPQGILKALVERNLPVEQFEIAMPTLDEIFIRVVQGQERDA
jgi:ABC-2 type transport system ATP-binding protein